MSAVAQTETLPAARTGLWRALSARPWACALALSLPLSAAYLVWSPPAADLAAAIYRSDLFARAGYVLRDSGWYAGHSHYVIGYSLLSPPLGALLGVRLLMAVAVVASCALFGLIAARAFAKPAAARAAALVFAFGLSVELLSGRVPYDLGLAVGLGSVLALMSGRPLAALALAPLTSLASPVAGAFLALVYLAWAITARLAPDGPTGLHSAGTQTGLHPGGTQTGLHSAGTPTGLHPAGTPTGLHLARARTDLLPAGTRTDAPPADGPAGGHGRWPLALAAAALAPIAALSLAFPEGGYEPFAASSFWPAFAAVLAFAFALPRGPLSERAHVGLRIGAGLYALALAASFLIATPMGGNAARLGPELAPALLTGVLWERRRLALCLLAPVLAYWQLNTPIGDYSLIAGQASADASYYTPLLSELRRLAGTTPALGTSGSLSSTARTSGSSSTNTRTSPGTTSPGTNTRTNRSTERVAQHRSGPTVVEVPLTATHMEAAYVAGHDGVELARGWDRQLDTRYAALFYEPRLSARAYGAWLGENGVQYVALPDAEPDYSARQEIALIERGLPYLREVWRSAHWRLFRVIG